MNPIEQFWANLKKKIRKITKGDFHIAQSLHKVFHYL
ncbi:MAG: hypothetical protein HEQ32_05960 [Vampirovibrio sp.]